MSVFRVLFLLVVVLFGTIGVLSLLKEKKVEDPLMGKEIVLEPVEVVLDVDSEFEEEDVVRGEVVFASPLPPETDRMGELFRKVGKRLPIVQTITYRKRVPWLRGRPAWVADYASHYKTSRHFIARTLNGRADYESQNVRDGDRFNVFSPEINFAFYLVVALNPCKMWLYVHDIENDAHTLIKSYTVGVGRQDPYSESGCLTPLGRYQLGEKIAVYRPKMYGHHQGKRHEMVRTFGTRWIPFGEELEGCTMPAQGLGIHGLPLPAELAGSAREDQTSLGQFASDGCIRLATDDMEELFSVIITRPTTIEIVKQFSEAHLPGKEGPW